MTRYPLFVIGMAFSTIVYSIIRAAHCYCLETVTSRRFIISSFSAAVTTQLLKGEIVSRAESNIERSHNFEQRDRQNNKEAIIRDDYWYITGKSPPRRLEVSLVLDDPQWNSFGSCQTSGANGGATNSCTYVSLKQRIPAYGKYAYAISDGAKEYKKLGILLEQTRMADTVNDKIWQDAAPFLVYQDKTIPPAIVDAELKMVLFATALLTSPNFPTPGRELLVARFYVNEAHFAAKEITTAIRLRDTERAVEAWKYGRDSWNSYFQVINKAITPKVGEQLSKIL